MDQDRLASSVNDEYIFFICKTCDMIIIKILLVKNSLASKLEHFFMPNSIEHDFFMLINVKMPTVSMIKKALQPPQNIFNTKTIHKSSAIAELKFMRK